MLVNQTTIDRRAMTALAKMSRKSLRRGRSGPVRMLAWFVVAVELFLTWLYLKSGAGGWWVNALLAAFMLGCLFGEDRVNGAVGLRRIPPNSREVNTTFQTDSSYVRRAQGSEDWWIYSGIQAVCETEDYFALLLGGSRGQVYDKKGFTWGTPEEFRTLIQRKTGLKIQYVK